MSSETTSVIEQLLPRLEQAWRTLLQNPQQMARLAQVVTILLIVLIAWSTARLTWAIFFTPTPELAPMPINTSQVSPGGTKPGLASVSKLHLFGKVETVVEPKTTAPIQAPETHLRLILRGVYASSDSNDALAIIAEQGKKDKPYKIGDSITAGAKLHQVYHDRVIIQRSGKLETLRLKQKTEGANLATTSTRRSSHSKVTQRPSRKTSPRVKRMREMFAKNPQKLWKQMRVTPVMKDGQVTGYNFNHNDRMLMREIGLKSSDVITSINGTPVSDMGSMMEMMGKLETMTQMNLEVLRNGTPQSISIDLN